MTKLVVAFRIDEGAWKLTKGSVIFGNGNSGNFHLNFRGLFSLGILCVGKISSERKSSWRLVCFHLSRYKKRVKVSRDRPRWSKGFQEFKAPDFLDFRHYEGGKVVTLTHRPSLPPGVFLVLIFRVWVDPRAHGSVGSFGKNPQWQHWGSIPRPFN
jgi:hypothetical protein